MQVHDWTRVEAGIYHDFHTAWIIHLKEALKGILPRGYYALAEQHLGRRQGEDIALHASDLELSIGTRALAVRHVSNHRIIALVEILSPSNKNGSESVADFVQKAVAALRSRIHLVLVDLLPPGKYDPQGMHAAVWEHFDAPACQPPQGQPLTLASYAAAKPVVAYIEHLAVGDSMRDMPLFLTGERYVNLPLASTYEATFRGLPDFWGDVLEGRPTENEA